MRHAKNKLQVFLDKRRIANSETQTAQQHMQEIVDAYYSGGPYGWLRSYYSLLKHRKLFLINSPRIKQLF